jgi:DtxR family Mn-dependent transcriptional regulator
LDEKKAAENACRMVHTMDKKAINRLVQFIGYVHNCPRTGKDWLGSFITFFEKQKITFEDCPKCLQRCLERQNQKQDTHTCSLPVPSLSKNKYRHSA